MSESNKISSRVWVVFVLLAFFGLAIIVKVFVIQIVQKDKWLKVASNIDKKELEILPIRGDILSSDGSVLAVTVPTYTLRWDTKSDPLDLEEFKRYRTELAESFAKEFPNRTKQDFIALFSQAIRKGSRYQKIEDDINFNTKKKIEDFPFIRKGKYKSGFFFEKTLEREQFYGNLAKRTIGGTHRDGMLGVHGLELTYNKELAGVAGKQLKTRIPGGVWKPVSDDYIVEPEEGMDLISTIDVHLQDLAHTALLRKLKASNAEWGCVVLMEVETGHVKAISNLSLRKKDKEYHEDINLAIYKSVDPGSTFKLPVLMAALEDGLIHVTDSIDTDNGYIRFYDKDITDTKAHGKGTVADIFAWSSNVGMAKIIDKCYSSDKQPFLDHLNNFGIGNQLGIELEGESYPKLYSSTKDSLWSGISHVQMAMGYETTQTPLQTLTFYNAIANDGKMMRPLFATSLVRNGETIREMKPHVIKKRIASKKTIEIAQELLSKVCQDEHGTAYDKFKDSPYLVAGKTGTNRVLENKKYHKNKHRGSFVGYFPADNPKYSCIVVVHKPVDVAYFGSELGAPVFKEIADQIFNSQIDQTSITTNLSESDIRKVPVSLNGDYKKLTDLYNELGINVTTSSDYQYTQVSTQNDGVQLTNLNFNQGIMPDLKDMSLQDAIYILENMGLKVVIQGVGRIRKQSIKKGTEIKDKKVITLELA